MSNLVDSSAHFDARAVEYGVPDGLLQSLKNAGFTTLGRLAFAISRPGQETDDARFDTWLATINGGVAPALGAAAAVKRLHFESEIVLTSMMRSAVESPLSESSQPKPIPFAEKSMRLARLKRDLNGIDIEGIYEPLVNMTPVFLSIWNLLDVQAVNWRSHIAKWTRSSNWMQTLCQSRNPRMLQMKTFPRPFARCSASRDVQ